MTLQRQILKLFGFFLLFYALSLPLWLGLKAYYHQLTGTLMFKAAATVYDLRASSGVVSDDGIAFAVANARPAIGAGGKDLGFEMDMLLDMDAITFNVPMTLSLMLALVFVFQRGNKMQSADAITNGMLALLVLHLLTFFVVSLSLIVATTEMSDTVARYFAHAYMPREFLVNFGSLLSSYAARFEPFLIALYVWYWLQREPAAPPEA